MSYRTLAALVLPDAEGERVARRLVRVGERLGARAVLATAIFTGAFETPGDGLLHTPRQAAAAMEEHALTRLNWLAARIGAPGVTVTAKCGPRRSALHALISAIAPDLVLVSRLEPFGLDRPETHLGQSRHDLPFDVLFVYGQPHIRALGRLIRALAFGA